MGMPEAQSKYFRLMEVVGHSGRYQNIVLGLFCVLVFEVGSLALGNPYYFAVAPYTCPQPYSSPEQCNSYVCSLPIEERKQYQQGEIGQLHTLGNQFGDYHCDKSDIISTAMGMFSLGSIVGYLLAGSLVDNFGRRIVYNGCLLLATAGCMLVGLSQHLVVAEIGLFMMGCGLENAFNLCFYFLSEQFENKKRQVGGVLIQSCFCVGGLATILFFFLFKQWRVIFWLFYFLPLTAITVLSFRLLAETPQFLVRRHSVSEIRQQLRRIAQLNGREDEFQSSDYTSEEGLKALKDEYQAQSQASQKRFFTFADLFKYRSLRMLSLQVGAVAFAVDFLYYGPLLLIEEFGFDFYLNGVIINLSELITYILTYFFITKIQRRRLALWLFGVALGCSFALLFLHGGGLCESDCWNLKQVSELLIVFVMRFAVSMEFQVFLIYVNELYPTQIVGMGLSYTSVVGTLPNVFIPELITLCDRHGIPIMAFFCAVAVMGLVCSGFLRETKGHAPAEKILEFGHGEGQGKEVQLVQETA